jgi:GrpB-like predicted nucleotidyltransferase (UPF0157 family)
VPYDPGWPAAFEVEAGRLRAALQPLAAYGKPLQAIGYLHVPHPDDSFCPFFLRPLEWPHTHHVHVVAAGGAEERRTLAFREYLRDHAAVARDYERLKSRVLTNQMPRPMTGA